MTSVERYHQMLDTHKVTTRERYQMLDKHKVTTVGR